MCASPHYHPQNRNPDALFYFFFHLAYLCAQVHIITQRIEIRMRYFGLRLESGSKFHMHTLDRR